MTARTWWPANTRPFQSAPLTEARGDLDTATQRVSRLTVTSFQSAPLTEARGDLRSAILERTIHIVPVSIRSPYRSKGRPDVERIRSHGIGTHVSIRSPYRSKGRPRWTSPRTPKLHFRPGFNPLPLPKQGETFNQRGHGGSSRPAPFQSAPLTEARGDGLVADEAAGAAEFRSVPLPSLASSCVGGLRCFNPLPLPKQGEIVRTYLTVYAAFLRFTEARGDAGVRNPPACFNPLPLPKQGEIGMMCQG